MAGERDLVKILASMQVQRRDEPVAVVSIDEPVSLGDGVEALIAEAEGTTAVVTLAEAKRRNWPVDFTAAWLTIDVHTALDGVGLTAALSTALADGGIACNILAGYFNDHLLVPIDQANDAIQIIEALALPAQLLRRDETNGSRPNDVEALVVRDR